MFPKAVRFTTLSQLVETSEEGKILPYYTTYSPPRPSPGLTPGSQVTNDTCHSHSLRPVDKAKSASHSGSRCLEPKLRWRGHGPGRQSTPGAGPLEPRVTPTAPHRREHPPNPAHWVRGTPTRLGTCRGPCPRHTALGPRHQPCCSALCGVESWQKCCAGQWPGGSSVHGRSQDSSAS